MQFIRLILLCVIGFGFVYGISSAEQCTKQEIEDCFYNCKSKDIMNYGTCHSPTECTCHRRNAVFIPQNKKF